MFNTQRITLNLSEDTWILAANDSEFSISQESKDIKGKLDKILPSIEEENEKEKDGWEGEWY